MLLSELIKKLQEIKRKEGDMTVVYKRYSDYGVMEDDGEEFKVQQAVPVKGAAGKWMMRAPYKWETDTDMLKFDTEKVLLFAGN